MAWPNSATEVRPELLNPSVSPTWSCRWTADKASRGRRLVELLLRMISCRRARQLYLSGKAISVKNERTKRCVGMIY
jgi:hypothetical protein